MSWQFCSVGRVIDALLAIPAADALGSGAYLEVGNPATDGDNYRPAPTVSDGPWVGEMPLELVCIGIQAGDVGTGAANAGHQTPGPMGNPLEVDEEYDVLSWIRVYDGDSAAQKKVRDRTLALFSVFEYAIRNDPLLGITWSPTDVHIDVVDFTQEDPLTDTGCIAMLAFTVHVKNRLIGP